jgi:signal transduction histidine kinase
MESPFNKKKREEIILLLQKEADALEGKFKGKVKNKDSYNELKDIMNKLNDLNGQINDLRKQNENE